MKVNDLIKKRRTIRNFKDKPVSLEVLKKCVNSARLAPSASNLQPLRFIIINKCGLLLEIFENVKFAGYLDWNPKKEEMPRAYIVVLADKKINSNPEYDVGLACENILLTALEENISGCIVGSVNKPKVQKILKIPSGLDIELVVALGYANEKSVAEDVSGKDIKYYKKKNVLHVPKRKLDDVLHINGF